ncbi:MAG: hypothetical protein HZA08_05945 [Nitrospirae bacterium]|nr:hypothetical protein [Nitrospirota bacterium]
MKKVIIVLSLVALVLTAFSFVELTPTQAEYADLTLNRYAEQAGMPPVIFPHWFHRIRFKCKVCHEDIFIMRQGSNDINMQKIIQGEYCGRCHNGRIAWAPLYCDRCHSGTSTVVIPGAREFLK